MRGHSARCDVLSDGRSATDRPGDSLELHFCAGQGPLLRENPLKLLKSALAPWGPGHPPLTQEAEGMKRGTSLRGTEGREVDGGILRGGGRDRCDRLRRRHVAVGEQRQVVVLPALRAPQRGRRRGRRWQLVGGRRRRRRRVLRGQQSLGRSLRWSLVRGRLLVRRWFVVRRRGRMRRRQLTRGSWSASPGARRVNSRRAPFCWVGQQVLGEHVNRRAPEGMETTSSWAKTLCIVALRDSLVGENIQPSDPSWT